MTSLATIMVLVAAMHDPGSGAANRDLMRDRAAGPTPVHDLYLMPPKIPDCKNLAESDGALKARSAGEYEKCDPERFVRAHGR